MRKEAKRNKTAELTKKVFLILVFITLCFIVYHFGSPMFTGFAIFGTENQSDFDLGTYDNTEWSSDHVQLTSGSASGTYTSKVFDASNSAQWNNISWSQDLPNESTDSSEKTCSDTWDTSCSGCTDNTMDSCESSSCDQWEYVKKVSIDSTSVHIGDVINVTVTAVCNDGSSVISIAYNDGSGWVNQYYADCMYEDGAENHSVSFTVTGSTGVQWVRGMDQYEGDSGVTCASDWDGDNDDANFTVIPVNTTSLNFQTRSDDDNQSWGSFIGPGGTAATYYTVFSGEDLNVSENRYFQYKGFFSTENVIYSPKLYSVSIDYTSTYVDEDAPEVTLINPADKAGNNQESITFSYNVTDESAISNCSLLLDGAVNQTDDTITKNITQTFDSTLALGQYNWNVTCTDDYTNVGVSDQRQVSVILLDAFNGDTTDLTAEDVSAIQDFTIEQTTHGKIKFLETIDLTVGADVNGNVEIASNNITLDANVLTELNKSAEIYLYNLNYTDPQPILNGAFCSEPQCTKISYSGGTFIFNVTSFSIYSSEEAPVEEEDNGGSSGGGGGGGGGGGSSSPVVEASCTESWTCTEWTDCTDGTQERTCTDANACGTTNNAPSIYETCSGAQEEEQEEQQETTDIKGTGIPVTTLLINTVRTTLGDYTLLVSIGSIILILIVSSLGITHMVRRQRKKRAKKSH